MAITGITTYLNFITSQKRKKKQVNHQKKGIGQSEEGYEPPLRRI
jgi:hypothetical protein